MVWYVLLLLLTLHYTLKHHRNPVEPREPRGPGGEVGTSGGGVRSGAGREGRSHGGSGALPAEAGHGAEVPMVPRAKAADE